MTTAAILDQFLDPTTEVLPADTAQRIIESRLSPQVQRHIDALAEKANQGNLSAEERDEYAKIVERLDLIAIFKSKARTALQEQAS